PEPDIIPDPRDDQPRCLELHRRQPANAPTIRITPPIPPKIHGDEDEDPASAASTTAGRLAAVEAVPPSAPLALGAAVSAPASPATPDADPDADPDAVG
ncbi:hypothetical protein KDL01_40630, partial [Actinospica durhamensis]